MHSPETDRSLNSADEGLESGFTLLEILVVVLIIGLLVTVVGNQLFKNLGGAQHDLAGVQLRKIESTLELYKLQNGRYPSNEQGLEALVHRPSGDPAPRDYPASGYMKEGDILDPWKQPFQYRFPGEKNTFAFDLFSYGADGVPGGEGENADIVNWDQTASR